MTQGASSTRTSIPRTNRYPITNRHSTFYTGDPGWNESQADLSFDSGGYGSACARYPHIKDLQDKAVITVGQTDPHLPVSVFIFTSLSNALPRE